MINREIPFRPRLEGEFRVRFYNAASEITEKTPTLTIARIAEREIEWVEKDCQYNIEQRKKYRAVWFLFRDLIRASWKACYRNGVIYMSLPTLNGTDMHDTTSPEVKALLRSWMSESRHERLVGYTDFINRMENPGTNKQSIAALIADGDELEKRIKRVHTGEIAIEAAVQPYLQLVRENDRDVFTGLKTSEIWRYFRLTWSTPVETTPGRTMQYLIRDAAHPMHAVMGIASLENCAVQITCRDDYIGWNQKAFIERIVTVDNDRAKEEFKQLLVYLEDGIDGIDYSELCTAMVVKNPTDTDIQLLLDEASNAEQNRQQLLRNEVEGDVDDIEKSELGSISIDAERALYRRKRAEQLARLLSAKKAIRDLINAENFNEIWIDFCKSETGNSAIRGALVAQKTKHIGSSMMELNVCGAIPPYNEILGGKLVALLATSPQVIHDYKERYADKASEIASRLKGMPVCRPADLVYVGTTSLYYVGSSQYNRLKMPGSIFNTDFDIVWKKLGMTIGFGTMHISKATTMSLTEATSDGFNRINHVFGEGASPKMRLLTMSIRELLESTNEDSKDFSKHAMSRIVYGACLAENTFDYLLGKESKPKYYTDMADYVSGTQKIIDFWRNRWLKSRLNYEPIYRRIRDFDKQGFLVSNQIDEDEEWSFSKLEEVPHMPTNDETKTGLQFVRDFYRGSSAYADHIASELLSAIHLETKLDTAIIESALSGKDIVLTGNPGDGKTHVIRMLKNKLEGSGKPIRIELDASTLSDEDIYLKWKSARENNMPFVIAINAAVLYSVYQKYSEFQPIRDAYFQMSHAVVFHDEVTENGNVVVFDLSKREVLTADILKKAIEKLTDSTHYTECAGCPLNENCDVHNNCTLLNSALFQERLFVILQRVSMKGYHATVRELQSLIAYLIFGNRSCKEIGRTTGSNQYNLVNLVFSGKGALFDAIRSAIDPVTISHPIWDERILLNDIPNDSWVDGYEIPAEAILKYQIVSECFRNVHDSEWQKRWCGILKKAFGNGASGNINIQVSGLLMHIKLSEVSGGKVIQCAYADGDEGPIEYRGCPIEYRLLTAKEIQQEVLGEDTILKEPLTADYDSDETPESNEEGTVVYEFGNPSYSAEMREQTKSDAEQGTAIVENGTTRIEPIEVESQGKTGCKTTGVSSEEIEQLVKDFKRSCGDYHVALRECEAKSAVVGPSVIRIKFKLGRGQALQGLASHLEDIGREMKRTGVIIQQVPNSDELLLDVPRLQREKVLFKDVISSIPKVTSPEQLLFPLGRTPNGKDLIEDLSQMPHMLVGGSTGSGKSVFLFSMLAALLMTHPEKEDMQLILSSSKLEDFIHFEGLPHLYSGRIISDATEATKVIKEVIFEESERRGRLLAEARVANIVEYNKKVAEKLAPIVVVIDEFADLADQLETTKEKNAFYKPVQRIAQAGRSRGIHLVICTQRPEAKLVPSTTKAQLNGRVALRVNDGISSRMIIEEPDAQYLQKHGDMIYRNGDIIERAQGYLIEIEELDKIVDDVIHGRI